jgi:ADP-ribose pyrophosphatase
VSWSPAFAASDAEIVKTETAFQGYFRVDRLSIRHATFAGDSIEICREVFKRGNAVCVLLYDPEADKVVMVEQFRVGALAAESPWMLEVVAGIVEPGETAEDVARREAVEEAGLTLDQVQPIIRYLPSGGGCDEWIDLMYAEVDSSVAQGLHGLADEGEDIKVHVLNAQEAFDLVVSGAINSSPAIIALQWLELNRNRLKR